MLKTIEYFFNSAFHRLNRLLADFILFYFNFVVYNQEKYHKLCFRLLK
ncbi:hypothetical protein LCGC14_0945070 [marine sediment metagenome]|uniref:Uncharacterized protein n=1 Tax=marine sediment metagenome TaxID=412755 RepID=A0A0F9RQA7_9ZZZZ